ncbi:hypothetical protein FOMPIDRAFT_82818 [Fomitopsis schrenkii]|uniref:Uncharacterized protein n=1 Tax=Fomitopsis schrenkii TaxID=2126942 RepID=S8EKX2_FOMSC|nr:hypothetical protein FOMPIDRAFT_82818 [Fomitopsis schrenkii]
MAAPALGIPIVVLNETLGAMLVGLIVGSMLQGINNGQAIYYFKHCQADPYVIKCLILFVLLLNALQIFLVGVAVYIRSVDHHSDADLSKLNWGDIAVVIVSALSDFGVKETFSYRVWRLSQKWALAAAIMSGAFVTFGFSLFLAITMVMAPNNLPNRVGTLGSLITLAISDVIMSVVLAIVFWRRRSMFASVNRILRIAILYTMETSLVTGVGSMAGVIMYVTLPNTAIFEAVLWILPHLILGSLLFGRIITDHTTLQEPGT